MVFRYTNCTHTSVGSSITVRTRPGVGPRAFLVFLDPASLRYFCPLKIILTAKKESIAVLGCHGRRNLEQDRMTERGAVLLPCGLGWGWRQRETYCHVDVHGKLKEFLASDRKVTEATSLGSSPATRGNHLLDTLEKVSRRVREIKF